jgi:DNA-binding NarL/FixJ family response regulator
MKPISILLVDDNPFFLSIAADFLQAHDDLIVLSSAQGGKEALAQVQSLRPDVVLIDLSMPDLPGLEVIPRLRKMLPKAGIIALTSHDTDAYRRAALDVGADDFISKRAMSSDLLPAIRRVAQAGRPGENEEQGKRRT